MLPSSPANWWNPAPVPSNAQPPPVESWKILSSTIEDNPPVSSSQAFPSSWGPLGGLDMPNVTCSPGPQYSQPPATLSMSIPQLPLPSMVAQQCGSGYGGGGFGWDRYQDYATTMWLSGGDSHQGQEMQREEYDAYGRRVDFGRGNEGRWSRIWLLIYEDISTV